MNRIFRLLCLALAFWVPQLAAGEFTIQPLRIELNRTSRAAEVMIRNEGRAPFRMQVQSMTWRQDADGKDTYEPGDGLIFFPRALEIAPGESRIVRVGIRAAPTTREETYRLFVEQLPSADTFDAAQRGATVRILLRVGVPVFVAPPRIERAASIASLAVKAGQVRWTVANEGNVHFTAEQVELTAFGRDGARLHTQRFQERYFLSGVVKPMQAELPREVCRQAAVLEATVVGDGIDLKRKFDVDPGACD